MSEIEAIKNRISKLYRTNTAIQVDVSVTRPRASVVCHRATITGVYPNLFQVKSDDRTYSISYTDVLTHSIKITALQ